MSKFTDSSRHRYGPVGRCIYCRSPDDLTREHIIPKSLGGNWVIAEASCKRCASITRDFEQKVSREMFGAFRSQFGFHSSTHKRKGGIRTVSITVEAAGEKRFEEIPAHSSPLLPVFLPKYESPGILHLKQPTPLFDRIIDFVSWSSSDDPLANEEVQNLVNAGAQSASYTLTVPQAEFCRMLAKIAHAGLVAMFGLDAVPSQLPDYILGRNPCLPYVVGGTSMPCRNLPDEMHWGFEQGVYDRGDQRFITVKIELFRFLFLPWIKAGRGPVYWIVVCPADDHLAELIGRGADPRPNLN